MLCKELKEHVLNLHMKVKLYPIFNDMIALNFRSKLIVPFLLISDIFCLTK